MLPQIAYVLKQFIVLLLLVLAACSSMPPDAATNSATGSAPQQQRVMTEHNIPTTSPVATAIVTATVTATATAELQTSVPITATQATSSALQLTAVPTTTVLPVASPTMSSTTIATVAPTQAASAEPIGSELLYLKDGNLTAYAIDMRQERVIIPNVDDFAATPDGAMLALVRTIHDTSDIWVVERDGSGLQQLTSNARFEGSLSWAPDATAITYASSETALHKPTTWMDWAAWCGSSEVHLLDIASGTETMLERGCDPAFSSDGRRIAFATHPQIVEPMGQGSQVANNANTIRLVNSKGENGWSFAVAGEREKNGRLVYAPAWSPDGTQLAYQRFIGYQALVDITYTEMGGSFRGQGELVAHGAGWLLPPLFSPNGSHMAIGTYNYSDARGYSGYELWSTAVVNLEMAGETFLPEGTRETIASHVDTLPRATHAAWSPDGTTLVVALPAGWQATIPAHEAHFEHSNPGELWRWVPGEPLAPFGVTEVDYASPLEWLP